MRLELKKGHTHGAATLGGGGGEEERKEGGDATRTTKDVEIGG